MRKQGSVRRAESRGSHHRMVTLMMLGMLRTRARIRWFLVLCMDPAMPPDRAVLAVQRVLQVGALPESIRSHLRRGSQV